MSKTIHGSAIMEQLVKLREQWPVAGDAIREWGFCPDCVSVVPIKQLEGAPESVQEWFEELAFEDQELILQISADWFCMGILIGKSIKNA